VKSPNGFPPLFNDEFAPTTHTVVLFESSISLIRDALTSWRQEYVNRFHGDVLDCSLSGSLREALSRLRPLEPNALRELLVPTTSNWVAYFNSFHLGTSASGPSSVLGERLGCRSIVATASPRITESVAAKTGYMTKLGAFVFAHSVNGEAVRNVSLVYESRWDFDTYGEPLPQEDISTYNLPKPTDRFGSEQLSRLLDSFGLHPFDPDFYMPDGGPAVLVERVMDRPSTVLFDWHRRPWKG
jgi:hypothetical protein